MVALPQDQEEETYLSHMQHLKPTTSLQARNNKIRVLYEEYISLSPVKAVWSSPTTEKPRLEPCFAAGFQGIELAFTLMAQFTKEPRHYVVKRARVELIAKDIMTQCQLVSLALDYLSFFVFGDGFSFFFDGNVMLCFMFCFVIYQEKKMNEREK